MSINQISNYNTNDMLVQSLMKVKNVSNEEEIMGAISSAMDSVSLSFLGKNFASYHDTLRREGDKDALEGLRQMAIHLAKNPNNARAMDFSNIMNTRENDDGFLNNFFSAVNDITESGNNLNSWFNTFTGLETSSNQDGFINASREILRLEGDGEDVKGLFNDFVRTTDQIVSSFEDEEIRHEHLDNFFTGLEEFETVEGYTGGIENFRENTL